MSVARVTELSATSETSFDDAVKEAVTRATKTLRGVEGAWVKDQNVLIEDGNIKGYKVNVEVTFLLENGHEFGSAQETGAEETSGFERRSSDYVGGSVDAADESFREEYR